MALQEYEIEIAGLPHTVQLDEAGAKALGLSTKDVKQSDAKSERKAASKAKSTPRNKARTPRNKAAKPEAPAAPDSASDPGASE